MPIVKQPYRRITCISVAALMLLFALPGCSKGTQKSPAPEIIEANIGGQNFFIPKTYLNMKYTSVGTKSALIQAWYPGDAVVPGDPHELWKTKQWYKNVRILITWFPAPSFEKSLQSQNEILHATQLVGPEFGLVHKTQPKGAMPDADDIWINNGVEDMPSFISCIDAGLVAEPQCKEYIFVGHYMIQPNYNRKLLPHWSEIHRHVIALFNSFQTKESSLLYLKLINDEQQKGE